MQIDRLKGQLADALNAETMRDAEESDDDRADREQELRDQLAALRKQNEELQKMVGWVDGLVVDCAVILPVSVLFVTCLCYMQCSVCCLGVLHCGMH